MVRRLALAMLLFSGAAQAQSLAHQVGTLHPSVAFLNDASGGAVATDGDTVALGLPSDGDVATLQGAVVVFTASGGVWSEQAVLRPSGGGSHMFFGSSLDLDGDLLVVGAPREDLGVSDAGAAYVFRRTGGAWTEEEQLRAQPPVFNGFFGTAVAVSGDTVAVGSPWQSVDGDLQRGAVQVFAHDGQVWAEQATLTEPNGTSFDHMGEALSLDGDSLAVGLPDYDQTFVNSVGAVRLYSRDGAAWITGQLLTPTDGNQDDQFGAAVSLDGDVLAVGSPQHDTGGQTWFGRASVYRQTGGVWSLDQTLVPDGGAAEDRFGWSLALAAGQLVVGAPFVEHPPSSFSSGAAYLFVDEGAGFAQSHRFDADDTDHDDRFGSAVDIQPGQLVVGAPRDDEIWINAGAGYVFDVVPDPWTDVGGGKAGGGGVTPELTGDGPLIPDTENALLLAGGPPNGTTHVVLGALFLGVPFKGGTFIPSPDILVLNQALDGDGAHELPFTWLPGVPVGTPFWTQHWVVEPGASFNLSASNGLRGEAQ
jgi:hypothetical protein